MIEALGPVIPNLQRRGHENGTGFEIRVKVDFSFFESDEHRMSHTIVTAQKRSIPPLNRLIDWCFKLGLLFVLIPVFVPFAPKMPAPGLDASWALGLNQAIAQGLFFGKDIIFTLGPYSSIYTKAYHPATDLMMIAGSLYLALSYWMALILIMNGIKWRWILAFAVLLSGMIYARDSLLFSYPLLLGGWILKTLIWEPNKIARPPPYFWAALSAPLGLLMLIKGSLIILCGTFIGLSIILFIHYKEKKLAAISFLAPLCSLLFFWLLAGQSIIYLPHYFISTLALASGFTEAMATVGNNKEFIVYLLAAGILLVTICIQKDTPASAKVFLLALFAAFLFLSFKAGFTRHLGHSFISGTSILIAALILSCLLHTRLTILVLIVSVYAALYIDGQQTQISLFHNVASTLSTAWHGFSSRWQNPSWARQNYEFTMNYFREQNALPVLQGTTDVYSYNQTHLIAAGMDWHPRPIFQSYSVFTADMAEKNKKHLSHLSGADNILFKIEPIDNRIPSLEDGASWPELLSNYHPTQLINDLLILRKNTNANKPLSMPKIGKKQHRFGEVISLPNTSELLYAEIEIRPTLLGLGTILLFKPNPLQITFELANGTKKNYRISANMAKSGFLLSPLIEDTAEFGLLFSKDPFLNNKRVQSITITCEQNDWQWHHEFIIQFKKILV